MSNRLDHAGSIIHVIVHLLRICVIHGHEFLDLGFVGLAVRTKIPRVVFLMLRWIRMS